MASLTPVYRWRHGGDYGLRYKLVFVENVSQNDTVTIDELDAIKDTIGFQMDTGTAITCTEVTNVVTITSVISSLDCLILVSGT